jgi:hypothetical protein
MSLETMLGLYQLEYIARCEATHAAIGVMVGLSFILVSSLYLWGRWGAYQTLTTFGQNPRERITLILLLLVGCSLAVTSHWLVDTYTGWA